MTDKIGYRSVQRPGYRQTVAVRQLADGRVVLAGGVMVFKGSVPATPRAN